MTMSTSSAPASTASATSASLTASEARPEGNAVATEATATVLPATSARAIATRSGYTHTAATGGTAGSAGSGWRALAHRPRILPGVSAPSSVVRSTIRTAISSAQSLASRLIDRVARAAARACAPVWSTPGSPCSARRSAASESTAPLPGAGGTGTPARAVSVMAPGAWTVVPDTTSTPGLALRSSAGIPGYLPSPRDPHDRVAGRAGAGEARLDDRVDDPEPLVEGREGALHRVDRQPFDVRPAVAERFDQAVELRGQRHPAHQPVVGVHRDAEGKLAEQPDRVLLDRHRGAGLHVGGGAHLQRDPAVPHVAGQPPEFHRALRGDPDVVHDAHPVPEALRAAPLQRLPDRREPEALAGVDGDVEVLPRHVLERVEMAAGWPARLRAGDVEPSHAPVPVPDREFG